MSVAGSGRKYFEPPPLKRMYPWLQDGSGQCDIIAGGVDETGIFKGVYVSGVHLAALLRTFALSKVFMPVDTPTPVASLGQSLADGIPIVIVTRGCFGRELDYGPGPVRNDIQRAVWQACRDMRAEMPQVLITCIDLPINLGSDMIEACLEPPLNEYRELMYQEGTWFTPQITQAASLGKWIGENKREPSQKKGAGPHFQRKKFDWADPQRLYGHMFAMSWRPVLQVMQPPEVPRRMDLSFVNREKLQPGAVKATPSGAEATFLKILAKARESGDAAEILAAVDAYLLRAAPGEKTTLTEAIAACQEFGNMGKVVEIKLLMADIEGAMKTARDLKASAADPKAEVAALKLILDCHYERGDLDEALKDAMAGKDSVVPQNDPEATSTAWKLLVEAQLAKGEVDDAVAAASSAASSKDRKCEAEGLLLVAKARAAKEEMASVVDALQKRMAIYAELGLKKEVAEATEALVLAHLAAGDSENAAADAKRLVELSKAEDGEKAWGATGHMLVAVGHLQLFGLAQTYLEGGEAEMLSSAQEAVGAFEEVRDFPGRMRAQEVLVAARLAMESLPDEGALIAAAVAADFKTTPAVGFRTGGAALASTLLETAQAYMRKDQLSSAYWSAKQAMKEARKDADESRYSAAIEVMDQVSMINEQAGKPLQVGGPEAHIIGDGVVFM